MKREANPVHQLQTFVEAHDTQRAAAKALGISATFLNDLMHQRRPIPERFYRKLGLKRIVVNA